MANFEKYDNSGKLFINGFKKEDKHPKWRGRCRVNGTDMDFAAWETDRHGKPLQDKHGRPYLSVQFSTPRTPADDAPF